MEITEGKSFPRGGKKRSLIKSDKEFDFILNSKPKIKRKGKNINYIETKKEGLKTKKVLDNLDIKYVEELNAFGVQDGMLVLGIVSQVSEKIVNVSLPGGLRGVISLANVSGLYKTLVESVTKNSEVPFLKELFHVEDVLPVKILSVSENNHSLFLTCDPKTINQKLSYNLMEEGFILTGSVKSKEDHGFIIDFGIEDVNAFLSFDKVDGSKSIIVGQLIRCSVINCEILPGSCSVQLSTLKADLQSSVINENSTLPINCFIPGFQFETSIKKVLIDGVEVNYGRENSSKGFIHEDQFLKKFPVLSDDLVGSECIATLLYIRPLVNFLFFKVMPKKQQVWPFEYGDIVSGKVFKARRSGVMFKIIEGAKKAKCFVPISKLKEGDKLLEDRSLVANLYTVNKTVSKIRLGNYNYMGRYYVGAIDKDSIGEQYFAFSDLKCGTIVPCVIISFGKSTARVQIGKTITGLVEFSDMTDVPLTNPTSHFKIGQKVKARISHMVPETRLVRLTMKPTLMKEKDILLNYNDYEKGKCYRGTVFKVLKNKVIVKFFGEVIGVIPKHLTPYPDSSSLKDYFSEGQLVKCSAVDLNDNNELCLSLFLNESGCQLKVGKKYQAEVVLKTDKGLFLKVETEDNATCKGYLPAELLTIHHSLAIPFSYTYCPTEKLSVYCVSVDEKNGLPVLGVAEIFEEFYEGKSDEDLEKMLTVGSVMPFLFKNKNKNANSMFLQSLLPEKSDWLVRVAKDDLKNTAINTQNWSKYQVVYGKVMSVVKKKINVSIKVSDVWDKDFHSSLAFLDSYLVAMSNLVRRQKEILGIYQENIQLGSFVKGVIEDVRPNCAVVKTESGDLALIEGTFTQGQEVFGKIVWVDGPQEMIYIIANKKPEINSEQEHSKVPQNNTLRGKVVFISQEVVVIELKGRGKNELAFLPKKRHLNDFLIPECLLDVGDEVKIWITRKASKYILAIDRRVVSLQKSKLAKKSEVKLKQSVETLKKKLDSLKIEIRQKRKCQSIDDIQVVDVKLVNKNKSFGGEIVDGNSCRKMEKGNNDNEVTEEYPEVKEEIDVDNELYTISNGVPRLEYDDVNIKLEEDGEIKEDQKRMSRINNDERIILSSSSESEEDDKPMNNSNNDSNAFKVGFNWDVLNNHSLLSGVKLNQKDSSSENEDDESKIAKKKKLLTANEKREKAKSDEERLRFIEERLMDEDREPETADDFDRALLSKPNSSALWLKYMAFHVEGTEIEKARAVARRALKSISFRQEQEKLNVWIALLNLENLYGNEDTLNKTLTEALQSNDPYKVHLHMLNVYGQNNKLQEMEKLGNFMMKKYKDIENMWIDVGSAYFSVGKVESARNVLQKALPAVDKNRSVPLISKFAHLENKYGQPERAQTLYESILTSFPKRVDIWSCYVDMLVKSNHIDLARQVLERATSQTFRPKKMKTLFKKFLTFEETYGTPENVEKVREAAVEYVQTVGAEAHSLK